MMFNRWYGNSASRLSFKRKITATTLGTTITAVCVAQLLLTALQWSADHAQLTHEHQALAEVLAANASAALLFDDRAAADETLRSAWQVSDVRSATLFDAKGGVFAHVEHGGSRTFTALKGAPSLPNEGGLVSRTSVTVKGARVGELVLTSSLDGLYARLFAFVASALAACAVAIALALVVTRRLARLIAGPVEDLSRAIADVRETRDFTRRVEAPTCDVDGADEFGRLTHDFNAMLADLENNETVRQALLADLRNALEGAEAANVAKSQFLANMSHEIRTPLNGVLGMTQALALDELTPAQRERVEIIRESGRSLLAVLNDILDISKIEAGRLELETIDFDLGEVARGACAAFTETANRKGVSFGLLLAKEAEGVWKGDSVRVRQILYNLISNALKFTSVGEVRVIIDRCDNGGLHVSVHDTGIGVAPDQLPKLFSKFHQTDSSTTRRFGGTGLGLAICRELGELMGGSISAESAQGHGSTFTLRLPLEFVGPSRTAPSVMMASPDPAAAARPSAHAGAELRVLAAEDNVANQLVLRALLQAFDITAVVVPNGCRAVEAWSDQHFDVILMDIQMPEMDGVTATRRIRALEADLGRPRTPIIALSANAMTHQVREYLEAGMDGHIAKPIEIDKLGEVLGTIIGEDESEGVEVGACEFAALAVN